MKNLPKKMLKEFIELLSVQSHSTNEKRMVVYLINKLKNIECNYEIDAVGNILITKGEAPYPCFAAHMDTVHNIVDEFIIKENHKKGKPKLYALGRERGAKNWKQVGIGGDDKCGLFIALQLLKILDNVKIVFFTQEEIGTIGANDIDLEFFQDCQYLIEADRKNAHDWITKVHGSKTTSEEFDKAVKPILNRFNFKNSIGLFTDVMTLASNDVGLCCVNVSCGYYNPHTANEFIHPNEVYNTILLLYSLVEELKDDLYEHKFVTQVYNNIGNNYSYGFNNYPKYNKTVKPTKLAKTTKSIILPVNANSIYSPNEVDYLEAEENVCCVCGEELPTRGSRYYYDGVKYCKVCWETWMQYLAMDQ